jgi:ATP-dependent Clp protease ATP-binding subunit ClpA
MGGVTPGSRADDLQGFGADARRALALAEQEARLLGHDRVGTEHLLLGLLADESSAASSALRDAGATSAAARRKVTEAVGSGAPGAEPQSSSERALRAIGRAPRFARDLGAHGVGSEHLLLAVLDVEGTAGQVLRGLGVDLEQLGNALGARSVTAAREEHAHPIVSVRPVCPGCRLTLDAALTATPLPVTGSPDVHEVTVVSCPACGQVLGLT